VGRLIARRLPAAAIGAVLDWVTLAVGGARE